jgi:uncharacterized protein (DUF1800 family)
MRNFTSFSPNKFTGEFTNDHRRHLLNRVLFGSTAKDLKAFEGQSLDQMLSNLMVKSPTPSPPVNYYQIKLEDTTGVKEGETWVNAPYGDGNINSRRENSMRYWWVQQMWFQPKTIHEKLILFWHNHFATELNVYNRAHFAFIYQNTLREHALGNLKDFVKAISIDPAMLDYLNGRKNTKDSPDENFARELQELFTIGKGENSNYTEEDVRSAARVMTGHFSTTMTFLYRFNADQHDTDDKVFSSFYNNTVIKGKSGQNGATELEDMLDMIFEVEEVSKFIVRKLYRYFIYYEISEQLETEFIEPIAQIFRANNYEIKPLLTAFFGSEHFLDTAVFGACISSPLEFMVKTLRHLEPPLPTLEENTYVNYSVTGVYMRFGESTQQYILDPPSVSGWPAYYQAPLFQKLWINSDTYQKRNQSLLVLLYNEVRREGYRVIIDIIKYAAQFSEPSNPVKLIDDLSQTLLPVAISQAMKSKIKTDILLSGQSNDFYWTELWESYFTNPDDLNIKNMLEERLRQLVLYLMSLPEYQLM